MRWPLVLRRNSVAPDRYETVVEQRDEARKEAAAHVSKIAELCREADSLREAASAWKTRYEAQKDRADQLEAAAPTASPEDIAAWEARVKAHDAWLTPRDLEARPVDGASARPTHPATELRRALERCQALEQRLATAEGRAVRKAVTL